MRSRRHALALIDASGDGMRINGDAAWRMLVSVLGVAQGGGSEG